MRIGRWQGPAVILVGIAIVAITVSVGRSGRAQLARDIRDIATLQAELDSVRLRWRGATTAADSARLGAEVTSREDLLGRRSYHIPFHTIAVDGFWRPRGNGVIGSVGGSLLLALGAFLTFAARRRRA